MSAGEAWFLGPRGENGAEFERLIVQAVRDHVAWRRSYHEDPVHITPEMQQSPKFAQQAESLRAQFTDLLAFLRRSVPFFSQRHQGHMTWETTMPALAGYFAAMLANPNNVAFEGSPATSVLERWVGDDLCTMLGYGEGSWGHLTSGGSVANLEALWALRNVKFHASAMGLPGDPWELFNMPIEEVLPQEREHSEGLAERTLQHLGVAQAVRRYGFEPVFLASGAAHHSIEKALAVLGLGTAALRRVELDTAGRLCIHSLREQLTRCLADRTPIYAVVVNIGSTEVGAIDPLAEVVDLRREFREKGLDFAIHADGAWGGYHACLLREDFPMRRDGDPLPLPPATHTDLQVGLGRWQAEQLRHLPHADTITVDPHKSGYIPYSAGAVCYRVAELRAFTSFTGAYAFHGDVVRNIGIFGVEGSKAGATAAAVYLSHCLIRPSRSGYGSIIGQAMHACRQFYQRLLTLARPDDPFRVVPLPVWPDSLDVAAEHDPLAMAEFGPDQNILCYCVTFKTAIDLPATNKLNRALYDRLSLDRNERPPIIVSTTDFEEERFGKRFLDAYKTRIFGKVVEGDKLTVLRSVVMNPWAGPFLETVMRELRAAILTELST